MKLERKRRYNMDRIRLYGFSWDTKTAFKGHEAPNVGGASRILTIPTYKSTRMDSLVTCCDGEGLLLYRTREVEL